MMLGTRGKTRVLIKRGIRGIEVTKFVIETEIEIGRGTATEVGIGIGKGDGKGIAKEVGIGVGMLIGVAKGVGVGVVVKGMKTEPVIGIEADEGIAVREVGVVPGVILGAGPEVAPPNVLGPARRRIATVRPKIATACRWT